jgi:hypothetical protein
METARKLGANQSMEEFEQAFKKIVSSRPTSPSSLDKGRKLSKK